MPVRGLKNIVLAARRLQRDDQAVAAVEFALIVPLLITLYLGSIEAAALFTVDKRVSSISSTVGDLVAQWDPETEGTLGTGSGGEHTDNMNASTGIMTPYTTSGLTIVVSLVQVKDNGTTKVLWSTANTGSAKTVNQPYTDASIADTTEMNAVSRGGCVIASEVTYSYLPVLGAVFTTAINLRHTNYFLPRFGSDNPINLDSTSVPADGCTNQT